MASWWPFLEFLARCEKIKNIQIFICKYETGIFGLRMALEAKSDLRFEIWSQNLTIHHVCYGLKLVDRRLQFHRNSGFFQANSSRLFWPQNGLGGQIRPHHWFSLGQFALPTKFQVSRASPWPSETRWTKRERETDNYYTCGTASLPQVKRGVQLGSCLMMMAMFRQRQTSTTKG